MALVHQQSCESVNSGLDLFCIPPTQTSIEDGYFVEIHPLATLSPMAPIDFSISGGTPDYLDLSNTFVSVQSKIVNSDGSDLAPDAAVAPVNYWLHSLFFTSRFITQRYPGLGE